MRIALPYIIAIGAQIPMFLLFMRQMMSKTHYQTVWLALIATAVIAYLRWPREEKVPFRESFASNLLLIVGLALGAGSILFVNTLFCAASVMTLLTSYLLRVVGHESRKSLWTAALPLLVFLPMPNGADVRLINSLQRSSAWFTSRILDLLGLGHYLDGTAILVPGKAGYGVEAACSGVQSFFTLLFIAAVLMVVYRRVTNNVVGGTIIGILGVLVMAVGMFLSSQFSFVFYIGVALLLWALVGFRAMAIVFAAVFWAMFINVLRILLIPALDVNGIIDLSKGFGHTLLGWGALALGVALLLSTDQLLVFLFGPVDPEVGETGPLGKLITRFWNRLVSGQEEEQSGKRKKKKTVPVRDGSHRLAWIVAGILALGGIFQLYDVVQAYNQPNLKVKFFDADITQPMQENDLPKEVSNWSLVENGYRFSERDRGADLGRRSDAWQYRAPRCNANISFDQTFPGWHELTTCYRNGGWKLVPNSRTVIRVESGDDDGKGWDYVEAKFIKDTGERGYLLFSLFNGAGEPMAPPILAGGLQSYITRAKSRLTNRIRRSLFSSEAYQTQVFVQHFGELDAPVVKEINERYLEIREKLRTQFIERSTTQEQ